MYSSLGFKPVAGFEKPIMKDGTEWRIMGMSSLDVINIPETMKVKRRYWNPVLLEEMLHFFSQYQKFDPFEKIFRFPTFKVSVHRPYVSLFDQDLKLGFGKSFVVSYAMTDRSTTVKFPIPVSFLPFKENSSTDFQPERIDFEVNHQNSTYHYFYKNGKLEVTNDYWGENKVILTVDPKFKNISDMNIITDNENILNSSIWHIHAKWRKQGLPFPTSP
jgi:hypothetical protein